MAEKHQPGKFSWGMGRQLARVVTDDPFISFTLLFSVPTTLVWTRPEQPLVAREGVCPWYPVIAFAILVEPSSS